MRTPIALAPLALLAACGGGSAANNSADTARYDHFECLTEMRRSASDGDAVTVCSCASERAAKGEPKRQAIDSCRQQLNIGAVPDAIVGNGLGR